MAYKRRYTRRRPNKRRIVRRNNTRMKLHRPIRQRVYFFKRFVNRDPIFNDPTPGKTFFLSGYHFQLNQVPGYTEFTNLFDFYKIVAVKVMFIPISNVSLVDTAGISVPPGSTTKYDQRAISVIDLNSQDITSDNLSTLREYRTCKVTPNNVVHKRYFYPRINTDVESTPGTSVGAGSGAPWLNTTSPDVAYYGIKFGFEQDPAIISERYRFECVYYMKFKNVK